MKRTALVVSTVILAIAMSIAVARQNWSPIPQLTVASSIQQVSSKEQESRKNQGRGNNEGDVIKTQQLPDAAERVQRFRQQMEPFENSLRNARTLYDAGDLAGAERAAGAAKAGLNGDSRLMRLVARIRIKQGRYQEALQDILSTQLGSEMGHLTELDMALCYVRLGEIEKARQFYSDQFVLERDSRIKPEDLPGTQDARSLETSILLARGTEILTRGSEKEAAEEFKAASQLTPNNGLIAYLTGKTLSQSGRAEEAQPYWHKAMQNARGEWTKEAKRYIDGWTAWQRLQREGIPKQQATTPEWERAHAAELQRELDKGLPEQFRKNPPQTTAP